MITACNTVNIAKKKKEAGTSQKQNYISVLRQFGNLVTPKADKAEKTADAHCCREPSALQQLLAGNLNPDPDLLQCNWNSMDINRLNCVNVSELNLLGFIQFQMSLLIFSHDNNSWSKRYQHHRKMTGGNSHFEILNSSFVLLMEVLNWWQHHH